MFLTLMIIGLTGLVMMAIPAFARHGHTPPSHHGLGPGHGGPPLLGHGGHGAAHGVGAHGAAHAGAPIAGAMKVSGTAPPGSQSPLSKEMVPAGDDPSAEPVTSGMVRYLPSPRAVFSVLALYGAFGNALLHAGHLGTLFAALIAIVPTLLVERLVITPVWNLVFRFQGTPSTPLTQLLFGEARAVTPFRNGRGLVSTIRDGRMVQLSARLREDQANFPVKVGEILRIEDVDAENERLTVSVRRNA